MTKTSKRDTYHRGNVRADLISTAERILAAEGVKGIGLRRLARELSVVPSAVYNHFETHEQLLAAVAADGYRKLSASREKLWDPTASFETNIQNVVSGHILFAVRNAELYRLMHSFSLNQIEQHPDLKAQSGHVFMIAVNQYYPDADITSKITPDRYPLVFALWSMSHGLAELALSRIVDLDTSDTEAVSVAVRDVLSLLIEGAKTKLGA